MVEYTKKGIVRQGNFGLRFSICLPAFLVGIRRIFGLEVERGRFQRSGKARQPVLRLIRANRFLPASIHPSFFMTEGKQPRSGQEHDKYIREKGSVQEIRNLNYFMPRVIEIS